MMVLAHVPNQAGSPGRQPSDDQVVSKEEKLRTWLLSKNERGCASQPGR